MDRESKVKSWTYRDAGVDIDRAHLAKDRIKDLARSTFTKEVLGDIGGFGGLYRPDLTGYPQPVLASSADGVGTKLKVAFLTGVHNTVGFDLVAHCTNDILVQGARPLFFLDYLAAGVLEPGVIERVLEGLSEGCRHNECVLLGGETAEMPDFYRPGEYDLAGFIVGIVDQSRLQRRDPVEPGDQLIGLPSSGLHTNGFSLVRRLLLEQERLDINDYQEELGRTLGEELLIPHRSYYTILKDLLASDWIKSMAHITGGGVPENLNRSLPNGVDAVIESGSWPVQPIFEMLRERGNIEQTEMRRTFNMGLGMVLIVSPRYCDRVRRHLQLQHTDHFLVGEVQPGTGTVQYR